MFNIAFPEFVVIGIVALVVIGPDKLPKLARGAGLLMGKIQRFASDLQNEMNSQLKVDDLNRLHEELRQKELGLNDELRQGLQPVASVLKQPAVMSKDIETEAAKDLTPPATEQIAETADAVTVERSVSK